MHTRIANIIYRDICEDSDVNNYDYITLYAWTLIFFWITNLINALVIIELDINTFKLAAKMIEHFGFGSH